MQQYYEKQVPLRERRRIKEGSSKGKYGWYTLYKCQYRIFRPIETTVRKGLR
jgi:hypothetical protein